MAGHTDLNILIVVIVPSHSAHFLISLPVFITRVNLVYRRHPQKGEFLPKVLT